MPQVEYLSAEIAGEGVSANDWAPGVWANTPATENEEWQPDIEPPHINDYAALKKHKHYRQYFRPYRYTPFPAWMYHATQEPKIVKTKEEVLALGPEWSPTPFKPRVDMTGKSLPVKSETLRLAEAIAGAMPKGAPSGFDANTVAAIVASVMAAMQKQAAPQEPAEEEGNGGVNALMRDAPDAERIELLAAAEKAEVKVDGRWSNQRIKKELGL